MQNLQDIVGNGFSMDTATIITVLTVVPAILYKVYRVLREDSRTDSLVSISDSILANLQAENKRLIERVAQLEKTVEQKDKEITDLAKQKVPNV